MAGILALSFSNWAYELPLWFAVVVLARERALALAGREGGRRAATIAAWLSLAGGCAIAALAATLLLAAFGPAHPLGL